MMEIGQNRFNPFLREIPRLRKTFQLCQTLDDMIPTVVLLRAASMEGFRFCNAKFAFNYETKQWGVKTKTDSNLISINGASYPLNDLKKDPLVILISRLLKTDEDFSITICRESDPYPTDKNDDLRFFLYYPIISREHCRITCTNGKIDITDLGSRNSTFIRSHGGDIAQLQGKEIYELAPFDTIFFGDPEKNAISILFNPDYYNQK